MSLTVSILIGYNGPPPRNMLISVNNVRYIIILLGYLAPYHHHYIKKGAYIPIESEEKEFVEGFMNF